MSEVLEEILSRPPHGSGTVISLLQAVQRELGYIPEEAILAIGQRTGASASEVFGVLTFYAQFRREPCGRYLVRVCRGTACHVRGGPKILRGVEAYLGIRSGETSADLEFTLEEISCFGSCSLSPVMVVNENTYGRLTPEKAVRILEGYRGNAEDN